MYKKHGEYLKKYYDLFMKYQVRTMDFFKELKELSISSALLYKYAKQYLEFSGTEEEMIAFKKLSCTYTYDEKASRFIEKEELYKKCYDLVMRFNGDGDKIHHYCNAQNPAISMPVARAKNYLLLSATEEEIVAFHSLKDTMLQRKPKKSDDSPVYVTICRELLRKKSKEEVLEYVYKVEGLTPEKIYNYYGNYKTVNPDKFDEEKLNRAAKKIHLCYKIFKNDFEKDTRLQKKLAQEEAEKQKQEQEKLKRYEKYDSLLEYLCLYMDKFIDLKTLQEITGIKLKEIMTLLEEFDDELLSTFATTMQLINEEKHNYVLSKVPSIIKGIKDGIVIDGNNEEYSLIDFLLSSNLVLDDLNVITDKDIPLEDYKLLKKFAGIYSNSVIFDREEEVYLTGFSFIINDVKVDISDSDKQAVLELLSKHQIPLYKVILTTLFKRLHKYGVLTYTIEYQEDGIIMLKKVQD